jgi:hypothetical protein
MKRNTPRALSPEMIVYLRRRRVVLHMLKLLSRIGIGEDVRRDDVQRYIAKGRPKV